MKCKCKERESANYWLNRQYHLSHKEFAIYLAIVAHRSDIRSMEIEVQVQGKEREGKGKGRTRKGEVNEKEGVQGEGKETL